MNSGGSPLLSVRTEARQLVAPDYAVVDGVIEHTAGSKAEAVRSVTGSLDRLMLTWPPWAPCRSMQAPGAAR